MSLSPRRVGARDLRVQRLRRLLRRSGVRESERAFAAEGVRLVAAALDSGAPTEALFLASDWRDSKPAAEVAERAAGAGVPVFELGPGLMERVADTVHPQPVCAVVASVDVGLEQLAARWNEQGDEALTLVSVDVRDPGNLGSVLRIAGATGASVVCCSGTVDPFNPKVVRASAGALFRVPLVVGADPDSVLEALAQARFGTWATVARGGVDYLGADLTGRVALVLGNEGAGLPARLVQRLDGSLTIPMRAGTESLNVASAVAVLCFDVVRRRRL